MAARRICVVGACRRGRNDVRSLAEIGCLDGVTVKSSLVGVPIFENLGFRQTRPERFVNGFIFIPVAHHLEPDVG